MLTTLQSLRFIFVMMIFMSHFAYGGVGAFDAGGDGGVAFFFLLSGFVVSLGYAPRLRDGTFSCRRFIRRRLLKLYPLHLLCLLFFLVVARPPLDLRVLLNLLLLQSWVPDAHYYYACNSVSWFLSSLLFCYLLFPWLHRLCRSRWFLPLLLAALAVVYLLTPYDRITDILYVNPLARMADFCLGIALCRLYEQDCSARSFTTRHELVVVILTVLVFFAYPFVDAKLRNAPLFWPVLLPLIIVFARDGGVVSACLRWRPLLWLGNLSMPLFMTHQMIIGILVRRLDGWPYAALLSACLVVSIAVSWLIDSLLLRQGGMLRRNANNGE